MRLNWMAASVIDGGPDPFIWRKIIDRQKRWYKHDEDVCASTLGSQREIISCALEGQLEKL